MTDIFNKFDRVVDGKKYRVEFIYDSISRPDDWCTHIEQRRTNDKRPGEKILWFDRGEAAYFDFAGLVAEYRRQGESGINAAKYAQQDFARRSSLLHSALRQWGVDLRRECVEETDHD